MKNRIYIISSAILLTVIFALTKYYIGDKENYDNSPAASESALAKTEQDLADNEILKNYEKDLAELLSLIKEKYPQTKDWEGIADNIEAADSSLAARCKTVKEVRAKAHDYFFQKRGSVPYRFYLWEKFYKNPIIDADIESKPDAFKDRIFSYICRIDPIRVLETAFIIDTDEFPENVKSYPKVYDVPDYLNKIKADASFFVKDGEEWRKWRAFSHLLRHTYSKAISLLYGQAIKHALCEIGYDLKDKNLLDVGTGSGVCLPVFREYIGKNAVLAAADIDPYALDACVFLNKDYNVKAFVCNEKDIGAPENSYDVITMLRVHLGPGIGDIYESHTVPWLKSVRKALKPGGLLVIYDDEQRIRTEIEKYVAPIGFKKVLYKDQPQEEMRGNYIYIFKAEK